MRLPDPLTLKTQALKRTILFAGSQLQGTRDTQEDYFLNFNDECFVVADGLGGMPNGEVASKLAAESSVWGYKLIRQRPYYWADKQLLLKRIFRSSNLSVWQKQKEAGYETGLASTLIVAIVDSRKIWVGGVGDSSAYLYRDGLIDDLLPADVDEFGRLTKAIGIQRLGLVPRIAVEKFLPRDILFLATDGVTGYISEDQLRATFEIAGDTTESISNAVVHILRTSEEQGSTDNMTACIIKRLPDREE